MTLGVLFVNVSIGGVLTSHAAPPVLMVATTFGWDSGFMLQHFGWRAAVAVCLNAALLTLVCRKALLGHSVGTGGGVDAPEGADRRPPVPVVVMLVHLAFLVAVVLTAHHPAIFLGLLMMFIGFTEAYKRYQSRLMIKEGLMVGFFLAGLVVLGGLQKWWLQDLLGGLQPFVLFWGATALTAITDNAALTYLGSLVEGTSEAWRYMLVAGAVTGGGLTVIANAPNPAGFAILKNHFPDGSISSGRLFLSALGPTLVAALMFLLPVQAVRRAARDRPQPAWEPSGKPAGGSREAAWGARASPGAASWGPAARRLRLFMKTAKIQDFPVFLVLPSARGIRRRRRAMARPPGRLPVVIWRTVFWNGLLIRRVRAREHEMPIYAYKCSACGHARMCCRRSPTRRSRFAPSAARVPFPSR